MLEKCFIETNILNPEVIANRKHTYLASFIASLNSGVYYSEWPPSEELDSPYSM